VHQFDIGEPPRHGIFTRFQMPIGFHHACYALKQQGMGHQAGTPEQIAHGNLMYHRYCGVCHGPGVKGGGVIPDLRHMQPAKHMAFREIVLDGILKDQGMVGFADVLNAEDVADIQSYVISEAHKLQDEL